MRNLRFYNTNNEFVQDEMSINNMDANDVETVIPGVALSKNTRKIRFNPKNKDIIYYDIKTVNRVKESSTLVGKPYSAITTVKYYSGTTPDIHLTNASVTNIANFVYENPYSRITIPNTTVSELAIDFIPKKENRVTCVYNITSTASTMLTNARPHYAEIDGKVVTCNSSSYYFYYNFDTVGKHTVVFAFSGNPSNMLNCFFSGITTLESVTFHPDFEMTNLANYEFRGCSGLTSITLPNSVTGIGNYAFSECQSLQSIKLPDNLMNIGSYCFYSATNLTSISIPDSVTQVGTYAFYLCISLENVKLSNSLQLIINYCFSNCFSLKSIEIPNSVTGIQSYGFSSCSALTEVTIGTGLTSIADAGFGWCNNLRKITSLRTTAPSIVASTFRNLPANGTLYYPSGSNYSDWLRYTSYYLGYYGWTGTEI